jgi:hypothetical protein
MGLTPYFRVRTHLSKPNLEIEKNRVQIPGHFKGKYSALINVTTRSIRELGNPERALALKKQFEAYQLRLELFLQEFNT